MITATATCTTCLFTVELSEEAGEFCFTGEGPQEHADRTGHVVDVGDPINEDVFPRELVQTPEMNKRMRGVDPEAPAALSRSQQKRLAIQQGRPVPTFDQEDDK